MGFDLYGVSPENKRGDYFRANVWSWRPIVETILTACDSEESIDPLSDEELCGISANGGYTVDDRRANEWADAIEKVINSDTKYITLGDGPLQRKEDPSAFLKDEDGRIKITKEALDDGCMWTTDVEHLTEFVSFCRQSGGFNVC